MRWGERPIPFSEKRHLATLLVGGYALAFHGAPRFTEDIDLLVLVSPENADKLHSVLADFARLRQGKE